MNLSSDALLHTLGRLHPALVHFPVSLLLVAALVELVRMRRDRPSPSALVCLGFGTLGAALAAASGWQLAEFEGGGPAQHLFRHRWGGVATASLALVAWVAGALARGGGTGGALRAYRLALLLAAGGVGYVGFLGGEMVWGVGHATELLRGEPGEPAAVPEKSASDLQPDLPGDPRARASADPAPEPEAASEPDGDSPGSATPAPGTVAEDPTPAPDPGPTPISFREQIEPILERSCYECHGPSGRARGGLRLNAREPLFEGDEAFWVILPGNAAESYLVELISLPPDHDDAMPAKGDPLSSEEVRLISDWIDQGASWE